jgi:DHA1 family multidrug resistance protein-like MFS transporter
MSVGLIRDSIFGRLVYHFSGKRLFRHRDEEPDYVVPEKYTAVTDEKIIKVEWDGDDDPENPKNWPFIHRLYFICLVGLLTASIYIGSAVYTPGVEQVMDEFNISITVGYLPLSLFVVGYGIGPMVFSPLSEHPAVGRLNIYIITLTLFVILQIPTSLANNIAGLLVLRFLAGVFASPALTTGGASIGDVLTPANVPIGITCWSIAGTGGPSLGPLIGGVLSEKAGWRWTFWFLLIMGSVTLFILFFTFPETSEVTLLYRKAQRLRKLTGNEKITSDGHIKLAELEPRDIVIETFWRPFEIAFGEPVVFFINLYCGLMYAIMYLWFEAFPNVFTNIYGFNMILTGVGYCSILVGNIVGALSYMPIVNKVFIRPLQNGDQVAPEAFLPGAIGGAIVQPIGIFIFAWSSTTSAHWIGPLIGAGIYSAGSYIVFQTLINYLAFSFQRYQASVFAGNCLFRAAFGAAFPLFANELYKNLGSNKFPVGWGCTILGFIATAMILIPTLLYLNGVRLRARSKYAN